MNREDLLSLVPSGAIGAEVGVLWGDFSRTILDKVKPEKLYLIDCWEHQSGEYEYDDRNFTQDIQDANYNAVRGKFSADGNVQILRMYSLDAAFHLRNRQFDFVYLDANHTYSAVFQDLVAYSKVVRDDGLIMGHDYIECDEKKFGVIRAVKDFCRIYDWELVCVTDEEWPSYALKKKLSIPKVIHTAWFGGGKIPSVFMDCVSSWMDVLPEYTIKVWRENDVYKDEYFWDAHIARRFSMCSDWFRCRKLYDEGGIWLDTDCKVLKPIDHLLYSDAFVGIQRDDTKEYCINPAIFGSKKGGTFVRDVLNWYNGRSGKRDSGPTICIAATDVVNMRGLVFPCEEAQVFGDVTVYPREYFFPETWGSKRAGPDKFTENTVIHHLFDGSWC